MTDLHTVEKHDWKDRLIAQHEETIVWQAKRIADLTAQQEPVAWSVLDKRTGKHWYTHESKYTAQHYANEYSHREGDGSPSMVVKPLYTRPQVNERFELIGHADLSINNIYIFNGYGEEVPKDRTPIYAGYKIAYRIGKNK